MYSLSGNIHEGNISRTWSAHISASIFLWQTFSPFSIFPTTITLSPLGMGKKDYRLLSVSALR